MTDDRYTVEKPPREGNWVYVPTASCGVAMYGAVYWVNSEEQQEALANRAVYRTPESALAHAHRITMADDILEALETLTLAVRRPGTAQNLAVLGANRVIARARGEVAP